MKTHTQYDKSILPPLICAILFALASWALFVLSGPRPDPAATQRLQKLKVLQKEDRNHLGSYAWVDRAKGWVRIPISRAMVLEEQHLRELSPRPVAEATPFAPLSLAETPQ